VDWLAAENRALRRESDSYRQRLEALEKDHEALALRHDEQRWMEERLQREVAAKEAELARERIRDEATGLFTRDHFLLRMREEFERALRRGGMPAPLFMGLQGLKGLSAEEVDGAMAEMGKILSRCLRQPDIATRFSEHELVVVPVDTDEQGGVTLARRVHREVARVFSSDHPVGVTFALMDYDVAFQEYQDFIAACDHVRAQLARQEPGKLVRYSSSSVSRAMSG
jgi:PleD family two-component response regulator